MKTTSLFLLSALIAFAVGCTTTVNETEPSPPPPLPTHKELVVTAEAVNITETTADIVVTVDQQVAEYIVEVKGAANDQPSGGRMVYHPAQYAGFIPAFVVSTELEGIVLHPGAEYLLMVYAEDEAGVLHSAHVSFTTKAQVLPLPASALKIANLRMVEIPKQYPNDTNRAVAFDLNKVAAWQVELYDSTSGGNYYVYYDGDRSAGAVTPLYLISGHNYLLQVVAFTQDGEAAVEQLPVGVW